MEYPFVIVSVMDIQENRYLGIHIGGRLPRQGGALLVGIVEEPEYLGN